MRGFDRDSIDAWMERRDVGTHETQSGCLVSTKELVVEDFAGRLFETMVFDSERNERFCERYKTRDEAAEGHNDTVQKLEDGTLELYLYAHEDEAEVEYWEATVDGVMTISIDGSLSNTQAAEEAAMYATSPQAINGRHIVFLKRGEERRQYVVTLRTIEQWTAQEEDEVCLNCRGERKVWCCDCYHGWQSVPSCDGPPRHKLCETCKGESTIECEWCKGVVDV